MAVIVRFAPSPTGHLHIGGLRTALFNELFARRENGKLLLRIEDTDKERSKKEYTDSIIASLQWAGIIFDDSPVIQSERIDRHRAIMHQLITQGKAYFCSCSSQEVADRNKQALGSDILHAVKYDRHCLRVPPKIGMSTAIRFKLPFTQGPITFVDLIRGEVIFDAQELDDFIIARSDGQPMYNFVVVVDDHDMHISQVIRGEDHISNTPKQILLYEACGFSVPQFAHLPMILGATGQRLSKRDGAVSVLEYKQQGYVASALINYLVRLGWAHGDQEKIAKKEMIDHFSLDAVSKHGARFDQEKLDWLNSLYIREMSPEDIIKIMYEDVYPALDKETKRFSTAQRERIVVLYKDRVKTIAELAKIIISLHERPSELRAEDSKKWLTPEAMTYVPGLIQAIENVAEFNVILVAQAITDYAQRLKVKLVMLAQPIRIALLGAAAGPGVFELVVLFGKQETIARLKLLYQHKSGKEE